MIALIASFRVTAENAAAFEQVAGELVAATRANEPGVKLYQLARSKRDPEVYKMIELYDDQAALDAHLQSDWFKAAGPRLAPILAEKPVLEPLDTIG